jgi:hypothetical protein
MRSRVSAICLKGNRRGGYKQLDPEPIIVTRAVQLSERVIGGSAVASYPVTRQIGVPK